MSWDKKDYEKEGLFYIKPIDKNDSDQVWAFQRFGFYDKGLGDLIFTTMRMIIETDDKSIWAIASFYECRFWLKESKRWPNKFNNEFIAKNSFEEVWYKLKYYKSHKLHGKDGTPPEHTIKYRPQHQMTRDPYIATIACAVHLDRIDVIKDLKIPIRCYDPKVFQWRKSLIGKSNCYKFLNGFKFKQKDYVRDLDNIMIESYNKMLNK